MTIILTTTAEDIARRITEVNNYTTVPNLYHTIRSGYRVCVESDLVSRLYISLASDLGVNHGIFQVSLILSALLCGVLALVAQLFSRDMVQETEKKSPYECGFFPFDSATRLPFDVHFYVVGIMFLVFDVELIILTTIIILAATMPWSALALVAGFVIILTVGFVYEWNCGALRWESKLPEPVQSSTNHNVAFSFSLLLLFVVDIPTYVELFFSSVLPYVTSTILPFFILGAAFVSKKGRKSTAVRKQSLRYRLSRFITRQRNYLVSRFGKPPVVLRRRAVYTWRNRQTVPATNSPSWRPRLWRRRIPIRIPIEGVRSWAKKKFDSTFNDTLFATAPWRSYHAKYSYFKRLRFFLRTRVVPVLHFHLSRLHRWPIVIVISMFVIPTVCVPVPWFIDDYRDCWRDLVELYDSVHRHVMRDSLFAQKVLHPWAVNIIVVVLLYPNAVMNILTEYHWPLMFFVGLAVARCWYLWAYTSPWSLHREFRLVRRFRRAGRQIPRRMKISLYDTYLDARAYSCPHPDKGREDSFSITRPGRRKPSIKLTALLWVLASAVSVVDIPFDSFCSGFDLTWADVDRAYATTRWYLIRDFYSLCWAFNSYSCAVTLLILVCGVFHGLTGLFISPLRRFMHPKCGRWVLPPLLNIFIIYVSLKGLAAWWQFNTFPVGAMRYEGWRVGVAMKSWLWVIANVGYWVALISAAFIVPLIHRKTNRYWSGRQQAIILRDRHRRSLRNRRFTSRLLPALDAKILRKAELADFEAFKQLPVEERIPIEQQELHYAEAVEANEQLKRKQNRE